MKKRLLSALLAACMMLTMMPAALAVDGEESATSTGAVKLTQGKIVIGTYDSINAALGNVQEYDSKNNKEPYIIQLKDNIEEDVVIPSKTIRVTIDLAGHTLSNSTSHTIWNKAIDSYKTQVTIEDTVGGGVVDNTTHGKAAVYNDANAQITLSGGTYTRSQEASKNDSDGGGNSYYVIKNFDDMTIEDGVTVKFSDENPGLYSSLIGNGWQDSTKAEAGTNGEPKPSVSGNNASLKINGGTFTGGQITVKNDDFGTLTIGDGTFTQPSTGRSAVANNHIATINGGTFTSVDGPVVYTRYFDTVVNDKVANDGTLTINGGSFKPDDGIAVSVETGATATISDGTFVVSSADKVASGAGTVEFTDGKEPIQIENGSFGVGYSDPLVVVTDTQGEKKTYRDLGTAMQNVTTGGTVQLRKDVTLEKGVKTGSGRSGITLDLNGYNIDGTVVKSADGVVCMKPGYGWKPVADIDPTMKIINSVPERGCSFHLLRRCDAARMNCCEIAKQRKGGARDACKFNCISRRFNYGSHTHSGMQKVYARDFRRLARVGSFHCRSCGVLISYFGYFRLTAF